MKKVYYKVSVRGDLSGQVSCPSELCIGLTLCLYFLFHSANISLIYPAPNASEKDTHIMDMVKHQNKPIKSKNKKDNVE